MKIRVLVPNKSLAEPPFRSTIEQIKTLTNIQAWPVGNSCADPVAVELDGDDSTLAILTANKLNAFYPVSIIVAVEANNLTIRPTSTEAAKIKQLLGFELNMHDTQVETSQGLVKLRIIGQESWVERLRAEGYEAAVA